MQQKRKQTKNEKRNEDIKKCAHIENLRKAAKKKKVKVVVFL